MYNLDIIWHISRHKLFTPSRAWSWLMLLVHCESHPRRSCYIPALVIYSTLNYVAHHILRHNATGIITFDQPLWWKTFAIILSTVQNMDLAHFTCRWVFSTHYVTNLMTYQITMLQHCKLFDSTTEVDAVTNETIAPDLQVLQLVYSVLLTGKHLPNIYVTWTSLYKFQEHLLTYWVITCRKQNS